MKKTERIVILDLTKGKGMEIIKCAHEGPLAQIYSFYTEKGEDINHLERVKHDTTKVIWEN